ncbi:MAG: endonuclease/exonuclease/phosphatase family protein [Actinomycetia bacterium]|nr:endonuclease/exonuclease/phosphatase family protein [Actinomycetes bacterium]
MSSNIINFMKELKDLAKAKKTSSVNTLRVMTYNIRWNNTREDTLENHWESRKENVASMIRFHNMDIIGLQEPLKDQIIDLEKMLPEYRWFGVGLENGKDLGPYDAVLFKKERFDLLDKSIFFLSPTPDFPSIGWNAKYIRGVTWIKLKDKLTGEIFYFFNTHFDYHSEMARNKSAKLLREKISEIASDYPYIVTGDFNIFPELGGKKTYELLTKNDNLIDAHFKTIFPHHGPTGSWSGFKEPGQPGVKPDYIFINNTIKVLCHGILADTFDGKFPSDHLPVIAELQIMKPLFNKRSKIRPLKVVQKK